MKKLLFLAVILAAGVFAACGGKKNVKSSAASNDSVKVYEQQLIEESIKMHLDSLAAEIGKLEQLPFQQSDAKGVIKLSQEELKVKPDYLLSPSLAEKTTTLAEKYRVLSALVVDRRVARLYEMSTDDYDVAIKKLMTEINDPAFNEIEDEDNLSESAQALYDAMDKSGRINYFWQMAATSLIEQLFLVNQNADKFLSALDDETAANCTFRVVLILDALDRLSEYDPDIEPVSKALQPLEMINATTVADLKLQINEAKDDIVSSRQTMLK